MIMGENESYVIIVLSITNLFKASTSVLNASFRLRQACVPERRCDARPVRSSIDDTVEAKNGSARVVGFPPYPWPVPSMTRNSIFFQCFLMPDQEGPKNV